MITAVALVNPTLTGKDIKSTNAPKQINVVFQSNPKIFVQ